MIVEYYVCEYNTDEERTQCLELNDDGDFECKHYKSWQLGPSVGGLVSNFRSPLPMIGKYLDKHNYAYRGKPTPKMMARCQRGLLSYECCSDEELKQFVAKRGLSNKTATRQTEGMGRQELTERLEDADDNTTFRFLDLPPELREIIYGMSFEPVQEEEDLVYAELPIRRASRQIKSEIDEVFTRHKSRRESLSLQAVLDEVEQQDIES